MLKNLAYKFIYLVSPYLVEEKVPFKYKGIFYFFFLENFKFIAKLRGKAELFLLPP